MTKLLFKLLPKADSYITFEQLLQRCQQHFLQYGCWVMAKITFLFDNYTRIRLKMNQWMLGVNAQNYCTQCRTTVGLAYPQDHKQTIPNEIISPRLSSYSINTYDRGKTTKEVIRLVDHDSEFNSPFNLNHLESSDGLTSQRMILTI